MIDRNAKRRSPLSLTLEVNEVDFESGAQFATEILGALVDHAGADALRAFLMGATLATSSALMCIGSRDDAATLRRYLASYLVDDAVDARWH